MDLFLVFSERTSKQCIVFDGDSKVILLVWIFFLLEKDRKKSSWQS